MYACWHHGRWPSALLGLNPAPQEPFRVSVHCRNLSLLVVCGPMLTAECLWLHYSRGYQLETKLKQPTSLEGQALAKSKLAGSANAGLAKVLVETLADVCEQFGDRSRADACQGTDANPDDPDAPPGGCEDESGWVVWDALERLGYVPIELFCEWWLFEARIVTLNQFVADQFPGSQLVERHGSRIDYALSSVGSTPRAAAAQGQLEIAVSSLPQSSALLVMQELRAARALVEHDGPHHRRCSTSSRKSSHRLLF